MSKQVQFPADTVDSNGKVWDTVGENIRNGGKNAEALLKAIYGEDAEIKYIDVNVTPSGIRVSSSEFEAGSLSLRHKVKNIVAFFIIDASVDSGNVNAIITTIALHDDKLGLYLKYGANDNITYSLSLTVVLK